jgi:hypothetical protein
MRVFMRVGFPADIRVFSAVAAVVTLGMEDPIDGEATVNVGDFSIQRVPPVAVSAQEQPPAAADVGERVEVSAIVGGSLADQVSGGAVVINMPMEAELAFGVPRVREQEVSNIKKKNSA